ncbi:unnamed protein product [Eruca vesicaria subsp. sativa]|uniref:RNase H type-1 domain-containing protein n=1 Tax=Eruca vesicaria subsp. sativa TaxID=29727 RepID=A0ABC8K6A4_ERUVS|nr:unnamed protein product [Eruca vesicaria subsp. sativa]
MIHGRNSVIKCNYDVSHHEGDKESGMGRILRNSKGEFITCGVEKFEGRHTIQETECSTLVHYYSQCNQFGL